MTGGAAIAVSDLGWSRSPRPTAGRHTAGRFGPPGGAKASSVVSSIRVCVTETDTALYAYANLRVGRLPMDCV